MFCFINVYSQFYGCNVLPKIRGPLLIDCNGGVTTSKYYLNNIGVSFTGINWELKPDNSVGTIIPNPTNLWEVTVNWNSDAIALNGYLLASYVGLGGGKLH